MGRISQNNLLIYDALAPWMVLLTSAFITAAYSGNFTVIELWKRPIRCEGEVIDGIAQVPIPSGFPLNEALLVCGNGQIYARLNNLNLTKDIVSD